MKKQRPPILAIITALFAAFTLGLFMGRNQNQTIVSVSVPAFMQTSPTETIPPPTEHRETKPNVIFPININTATETELRSLPGVGEVLAKRILTYRSEHGSFSSVEALMNVEGIGEKTMEDILDLITIGG